MSPTRVKEIKDNIDKYLAGSRGVSEMHSELCSYITDQNLMLSDLDHFLELEELTHEQIANLTLRRKVALSDRRRAKDFISVIDQILPKQIEGRTTHDRYDHAIRGLTERVYTPRKINLDIATGALS